MSELIDELMDGPDANSSNDTVIKEIKDFKRVVIDSIDKFISYIKLNTKKVNAKKIALNMMLIINQILRHL